MAEQLFFGKVENFSPTNRFTNLRADYVSGSNTLTNVIASSGTLPWELMRIGQRIANTPELVGFAEILSFNSGSGTITLDQNATVNATQNFTQWWVAEDTYYVPSSSFLDPNTVLRVNDITGSADADYDGSTPIYAVLGQSTTTPGGTVIEGSFHKWEISEVVYRDNTTNIFSFILAWGEQGTEASSNSQLYTAASQKAAIVSLSTDEKLAPIFSNQISGITDLPATSQFAGYQIEITDFFDDLSITDIYYTGSLVSKNNGDINFTGSGVVVTTSGSNGVTVEIAHHYLYKMFQQ